MDRISLASSVVGKLTEKDEESQFFLEREGSLSVVFNLAVLVKQIEGHQQEEILVMNHHGSQNCLPAVPVLFVQRCTYRLFLGLSKSHSCLTVDLFIFKTVVVTKLAVSANLLGSLLI
ncbi:hypothetical protein EDC96DRAFT_550684 [Choanephora cucurbitarum]|nr:hypothetical protein EDC96DRAFT_550684 [Choanephora cucurbitarum]